MKAAIALATLLVCAASVDAKPKVKKKPPAAAAEPEIEMEPDPVPAPEAATVEPPAQIPPPRTAPAGAVVASKKPKKKRLYVRAGVAIIKPMSVSREMELADVDGAASLGIENGPIAGSGASVSSATLPAITIGYRLPWLGGRLAIETILGVPFDVEFKATGTLRDRSLAPTALGLPTGVQPLGDEVGTAKAAPPTVTAVYTLYNKGRVQPYVGAGVSVLLAFDEKVTNRMLTEVSEPEMHVSPAPGLVFQGGIDAQLWGRVYARLDVKFIALMMARAEVRHVQVRTPGLPLFDNVEVGTARMNVWVNPVIVQAGIGTDF